MKGRYAAENLVQLDLTPTELHEFILVFDDADLSDFPDRLSGRVNRWRAALKGLERTKQPFEN